MSVETAGIALIWKVAGGVLLGIFNFILVLIGYRMNKSVDRQDDRLKTIESTQANTYTKDETKEYVESKLVPVRQKQIDFEERFHTFLEKHEKMSTDLAEIKTLVAVTNNNIEHLKEGSNNAK